MNASPSSTRAAEKPQRSRTSAEPIHTFKGTDVGGTYVCPALGCRLESPGLFSTLLGPSHVIQGCSTITGLASWTVDDHDRQSPSSPWSSAISHSFSTGPLSLFVTSLVNFYDIPKTSVMTSSITFIILFRSAGAIIFGISGDYWGRKWPMCVRIPAFNRFAMFVVSVPRKFGFEQGN